MDSFLTKAKQKFSEKEFLLINSAIEFASKLHEGQMRHSGEPYIVHPLHVAEILVDLQLDVECVVAAILHDILEDTKCTADDIKKLFGADVLSLVEGVTKLSKFQYESFEDAQAENYRKLFFAVVQDIRILFIKLADRLHNMRTLAPLRPDKRERIALETMDIYAPMAGRLGIMAIKCELEDLAMKYLYPEDYLNLTNSITKASGERMGVVMRIMNEIEIDLNEYNISGEVKGRSKHLYSIYKKIKTQGKALEEIYDLMAIRVIVETVRDCYTVLGVIHSKWKPLPGRFKDYIAMPKPNLYQSLHTTVVTEFGQPFEIQIRTYEMNKTAEYGIAAHWLYKEKGAKAKAKGFDEKLGWLREVIENDAVKDSKEFLSDLKLNILSHEIYVFTPKGTVLNLPKGSTPVDFAYKVHSEIGNKCSGAIVNKRIVPLNTQLENGNIVEILTGNTKGPSRDWLKFAVTPQAKSRIKAFFRKKMEAENIKTGKDMLDAEAKRRGYQLNDLLTSQALEKAYIRYSLSSLDDLYASVGYGGLTTNQILVKLIDAFKKEQALHHIAPAPQELNILTKDYKKSTVIVEDFPDFEVKFPKCCNPVPGDLIIGYAARGTGVAVHRRDCPNVAAMEEERIMRAKWALSEDKAYVAHFRIECIDQGGLLNQVISMVASLGYSIHSINANAKSPHGVAVINLGVVIKNVNDVEYLIKKISSIPDILTVKRRN